MKIETSKPEEVQKLSGDLKEITGLSLDTSNMLPTQPAIPKEVGKYSDFLKLADIMSGATPGYTIDPKSGYKIPLPGPLGGVAQQQHINSVIDPYIQQMANQMTSNLMQTIGGLAGGMGAGISASNDPYLKKIAAVQAELLDAQAKMLPNAPHLAAQLKAMQQSYAATNYQTEGTLGGKPTIYYEKISLAQLEKAKQQKDAENKIKQQILQQQTKVDWDGFGIASQPKTPEPQFAKPDEQKFVQRVGMLSNCNVNIQSKFKGFSRSYIYRLVCEQCQASANLDEAIMKKYDHTDPAVTDFCRDHRHDYTPQAEGRRFRA